MEGLCSAACLGYHLASGVPCKGRQAAAPTHSLGGPGLRFSSPHHPKQASDCFCQGTLGTTVTYLGTQLPPMCPEGLHPSP